MRDVISWNLGVFCGTRIAQSLTRPGDLPDTEILAHAPEHAYLSAHIANRTLNISTFDRPVTLPSLSPS